MPEIDKTSKPRDVHVMSQNISQGRFDKIFKIRNFGGNGDLDRLRVDKTPKTKDK